MLYKGVLCNAGLLIGLVLAADTNNTRVYMSL